MDLDVLPPKSHMGRNGLIKSNLFDHPRAQESLPFAV